MPNHCCLDVTGHITRDIEVRQAGEHSVASFGIAYNRKRGAESHATFIDCKAWNKTADAAQRFLSKGIATRLIGRLEQENWKDKATGAARSKLVMVVGEIVLFGDGQPPQRQEQPAEPFPLTGDGPGSVPF